MSRIWWLTFAAIVVAAAFLRLHGIGAFALNNDEIAEVRWSSGSFSDMWKIVAFDKVHPPLDYFVQYAMGKAGAAESVRRLPAILAGILTAGLVMLLGWWWHSPAAGMITGVVIAVSPMHIRYAQEIRPYSMGICFLAGSLVALELYARTSRRGWLGAWFAAVFLAGATLYLAGVVAVIASAARILVTPDAFRWIIRRSPLIVTAWTVLYAPWLGVVAAAARRPPPAGPERIDWAWWRHRLQTYGTGTEFYEPVSVGSWALWIAVVIGLVAAIRTSLLRTAAGWLLGGGAVTVLILQMRPHYAFAPRYVMAAMTAAVILAGAGIITLSRWWAGRAAAPVLLASYVLFAGVTLAGYYDRGRPDWRAVAEYVHERAQPGDRIILTNNWVIRNFGYYWRTLPPRPAVTPERYIAHHLPLDGPAWIVAAHCRPRAPLAAAGMMWLHEPTEQARIYYLRPGQEIAMQQELCPE